MQHHRAVENKVMAKVIKLTKREECRDHSSTHVSDECVHFLWCLLSKIIKKHTANTASLTWGEWCW